MIKRWSGMLLAVIVAAGALGGCNNTAAEQEPGSSPGTTSTAVENSADAQNNGNTQQGFDSLMEITVVTREDGSGTRGAFIELLGIEQADDSGTKVDRTTLEAIQSNSTSVMMTTVAGDPYAIGYISLGSLNDTVKAVKIDGAEATVEAIENGSYKVARPFNIATTADLNEAAQDFIGYILSDDGQRVVEDAGYISVASTAYAGASGLEGRVVVAGSSSVTPVMEKLKEAYAAVQPGVEIEIQQSDSSTGMTSTVEGICDIGMASRDLKDSELEQGLTPTVIATDGIAVVVNNANPVDGLSAEQVQEIFTGEVTSWAGIA